MTRTQAQDKSRMKSAARFYAVQALFQMEQTDQTVDQVIREFLDHRFGTTYEGAEMLDGDVDAGHFQHLVEDAVNYQARVDQMTNRALVPKWSIARIDSTLRGLFRAAGAELTCQDTPPKVVINEFVDIARAFFPEGRESEDGEPRAGTRLAHEYDTTAPVRFVNAVLDHMAREAQPGAF
ncbi:MAG: transcription antitermination protein NusB [Rhodobacteraceae bacterium]|nr:transcription antitermination protein NusB [Paracoccaceae bacterium]